MKLGIITDTHGEEFLTQHAVEIFLQHNVQCVIHCGDIGTRSVIEQLAPLPCHFVFGNCDTARESLAAAITAPNHILHGDFGFIEVEVSAKTSPAKNPAKTWRIFFLHGHHWERLDRAIASGEWDLVCYGHTHVATLTQHNETLVVNAGGLQRIKSPSIAIVDLETGNVSHLSVK